MKEAEQEDEYGEEEEQKDTEKNDDRRHSHRGRGGFAKTYGGRTDEEEKEEGQHGSKLNKRRAPKDEYFDAASDSEEEGKNAYSKPSRGGGQ